MVADLVEPLIILLATVLLSGIFAPYILKTIDERRTQEQQKREAKLSRQAKLIDAQADFLDKVAALLWEWRYSYIRVAYYESVGETQRYKDAWEVYADKVWANLSQIRYQISLSRRLISDQAYKNLLKFYGTIVTLDRRLLKLTNTEDSATRKAESSELYSYISGPLTEEIDTLLNDLAVAVQLNASPQDPPEGRETA